MEEAGTSSRNVASGAPAAPSRFAVIGDRACLWCDTKFTPERTLSGESTEHYCQPECGWKAHYAKQSSVVFGEGIYERLRAEDKVKRADERAAMQADKETIPVASRPSKATPSSRPARRQPQALPSGMTHEEFGPAEDGSGTEQMSLDDVRTKVMIGTDRKTGQPKIGMTYEEFAAAIGTKRSTLYHWIMGKNPVPVRFVEKIQALVNEAIATRATITADQDTSSSV